MNPLNLLIECETGTIFVDNAGRVWQYKKAWDNERMGYLVGITKDTPTFTFAQLHGISVDGFRKARKGEYNPTIVKDKFAAQALT